MDAVNISSAVSSALFTGASNNSSNPVITKPAPAAAPATTNATQNIQDSLQAAAPQTADDARLAAVQKAAQAVAEANYYPVSDVRFTIYKDIAGEYVTRFTSLKDGKVTYYPQKSLQELMKLKNAEEAAIFHTKV